MSQKSLSSLTNQRHNASEYHSNATSGGGGAGLPLPTSQPVLQRARRCTASKSSSSIITAEPKIAPARTNARLLNTLLQHCRWTNTDSWSTHKQHTWLCPCRHTHNQRKQKNTSKVPPHHTSFSSEDTDSADYSQQTELRFMVLSSAQRQRWIKKKEKPGKRGWTDGQDWRKTINARRERDRDIPLTLAAPGPWVGGRRQRHRVAEDLLTSHFSWMELSDAERTRLKEQRRRGGAGEVELSAQTQERRSDERWRGQRRRRRDVFQSRASWEQQVRLRWRLCK